MSGYVPTQGSRERILVSDFDGTLTRFDFYDLACRRYPAIAGDHWQRYEAGELSHFEALRRIFAGLRAPEPEITAILREMQLEPRLGEALRLLDGSGWKVQVASAGCDWYIRRLLADAGVALEVHANPGTYSPEGGLAMRLPEPSPFFSSQLGVNKVAVVREALRVSDTVAFAGDGRPDLAPALLVRPELRFARSWLARRLGEIGEPFPPFDSWFDVAAALARPGARP